MKKIILILIIAGGWYVNKNGWPDFMQRSSSPVITNASILSTPAAAPASFKPHTNSPAPTTSFRCDGRQHCSQMSSYDEAVFFLRNCPNTKMDGDGDGIPCERQFGRWCRIGIYWSFRLMRICGWVWFYTELEILGCHISLPPCGVSHMANSYKTDGKHHCEC